MLDSGLFRLKHFEAYEKYQDAAGDLECWNGNTEELEDELAQQDKDEDDQKGYEGCLSADLSFCLLVRIFHHGGENRHVGDGIHDRKKSREDRERKGKEVVLQVSKALENQRSQIDNL